MVPYGNAVIPTLFPFVMRSTFCVAASSRCRWGPDPIARLRVESGAYD
jgi:hypothetical protein